MNANERPRDEELQRRTVSKQFDASMIDIEDDLDERFALGHLMERGRLDVRADKSGPSSSYKAS